MIEKSTIEHRLSTIIQKVLHNYDLEIRPDLTASEVPGWDSLSHIQIIIRAEKEFFIKFKPQEISRVRNVGDLLELITQKTALAPRTLG